MTSIAWLLLLIAPISLAAQDTYSQDLAKEMDQNAKKPLPKSSPFQGDGLFGSGRLCTGQLLIGSKTLSWMTNYSECKDVPYETLEMKQTKDGLHAVYLLKTHDPKCAFRILVLFHATPPDGKQIGFEWNATGYGSWKGYKKDDPGDQLSCNMY